MKSKFSIFAVLLLILVSAITLYALEVKVGGGETAVNVRAGPSAKAEKVTVLLQDQIVPVIDEKVAYYKADIADVKRGNINGWVWAGVVEKDKDGLYVGGKGVTLRNAPSKKAEADGFVWPKSRLTKIHDKKVTWYKVKVGDAEGWIYAGNLALIGKK